MSNTRSIDTSSLLVKGAVVLCVVLLIGVSWFTVRRALGVTVSANTESKELADIAIGLAPDYGFAHFAAGVMLEKTFLPDDLARSVSEFENAVALSPHDFRLWLELARSYEKNGDEARAEAAFRKTLELAPNYSRVQWAVGNYLLRADRSDEAFGFIRQAADREFALADAAAAVAWNIYDADLARIESYFAGSVNLQSGLAAHLAGQGRFDDAMRIWSSLPQEKREGELGPTAETLRRKLTDAKKFLYILKMNDLEGRGDRNPGEISNGDFEGEIKLTNAGQFEWQFADGSDAQFGIDVQQMRGGVAQKTLAIIFNSDGKSFRGISQVIPIEAGRRYALSVAYRSDLKNRATMRWEIVNTVDSNVFAATEAVAEQSDWAELKTEFTVPEKTEGIVIRLVRTGCLSTICPITGKVWFDDVKLTAL